MSENTFMERERALKVKGEYDVLVAGGGTAGVVAAIAAARNGANTILVERYGFLGGTMINGACSLHSYFNVYKPFPGVERKQLVKGIPSEIVDRMIEAGGCLGNIEQVRGYGYDTVITPIDHEVFKAVIVKMMEESGVKLLLHTLMVDTITEGDTVKGIIIESKSGREAILAKTVIDTTGDGDVAFRAGAECIGELQPYNVGLSFSMANVNIEKAAAFFEENGALTQLAYADKGSVKDNIARFVGQIENIDKFKGYMQKIGMMRALMTYSLHRGDLTYINSVAVSPLAELTAEEMTRAEVQVRHQLSQIVEFIKTHIPGFQDAYVSWTGNQIGIRRTRVIDCEYDITANDVENGSRFEDEIALYGFHDMGPRRNVNKGGYYGIPYRALLPKKIENLLVAGRMITSDWTAHMSTRNVVSCMAQGQAVGTAAALCSKLDISPGKLNVKTLQETLIKDGVYLEK